jgi:hypothetical protein
VGSTVWVVDANNYVYVYTNHGVLLGSWAAGGLPNNAQATGIATNGSDIWIVATGPGKNKVYKFSGAATLLSGTQSANSSFSLNNADSNPQDIVTDGTSFWVVDSSALKVFKYTLSGSLLGSWSIDPANAHPTGITVNPTNPSDIWIVDSGTLKVYDYTAAASRTSGSQNASVTFALNPYDTDPQGIADPPAPDTALTAGDSLVQETPPDTIATPFVQPVSLPPRHVRWLPQTTRVPFTSSSNAYQLAIHATAAPLTQLTLPVGGLAMQAPGTSLMLKWTPRSQDRILDQVFSDQSLGLVNHELLSCVAASV